MGTNFFGLLWKPESPLFGMMKRRKTNTEIRQWYLERVSHIRELNQQWMSAGLAARERAQEAWHLRHTARLDARAMMDPTEAELLRARDLAVYGHPDGPTFEYLVKRGREAGLVEEAMYEAIIEGSYRTNPDMNRGFGF